MTSRPCALDLGSGTCGFLAATFAPDLSLARALPLPVPAVKSPPSGALLLPVVDRVIALLREHGADLLVMEIGWLYSEGDSAAKALAIARHHEVCAVLSALIEHECAKIGIPTATIARSTWAGRLVPKVRGVTNAAAAAAAIEGLDVASLTLLDGDGGQHCRDALGALRGWLMGPPVKPAKAPKVPRDRAARPPRPPPASEVALLRALADGPMSQAAILALLPAAVARLPRLVLAGTILQSRPRGPYCLPGADPEAPVRKPRDLGLRPPRRVLPPPPKVRAAATRLREIVAGGTDVRTAAAIVGVPYLEALRVL